MHKVLFAVPKLMPCITGDRGGGGTKKSPLGPAGKRSDGSSQTNIIPLAFSPVQQEIVTMITFTMPVPITIHFSAAPSQAPYWALLHNQCRSKHALIT